MFSQKKYNEAFKELTKASELEPSNMIVMQNLGLVDVQLKRYNEAINKLTTVINSKKITNGKPEYFRGICYLNVGNKIMAGVDFRSSLKKGFKAAKDLDKNYLAY